MFLRLAAQRETHHSLNWRTSIPLGPHVKAYSPKEKWRKSNELRKDIGRGDFQLEERPILNTHVHRDRVENIVKRSSWGTVIRKVKMLFRNNTLLRTPAPEYPSTPIRRFGVIPLRRCLHSANQPYHLWSSCFRNLFDCVLYRANSDVN